MDAKLIELGLDQVKEPERSPEPVAESGANAQHIPEDVMVAASEDRVARAMRAYQQAGTPAPAIEGQGRAPSHEMER